jgi:hypothetical protein
MSTKQTLLQNRDFILNGLATSFAVSAENTEDVGDVEELRSRTQENGPENCIMMSFKTCALLKVFWHAQTEGAAVVRAGRGGWKSKGKHVRVI